MFSFLSRPQSAPPRMETGPAPPPNSPRRDPESFEAPYEIVWPDDTGYISQNLIGPAFEYTANALSSPMGYLIDSVGPTLDRNYLDDLNNFQDSAFGHGSYLGDFAYGVADTFLPIYDSVTSFFGDAYPPSPPLVGVETNPGPPSAGRAARRRLKRKLKAARKATAAAAPFIGPLPRPRRRAQQQPQRTMPSAVAAAYSTGISTAKPVIIRTSDDSTRIRHSELLTLVPGTVNFTASTFSMQPGLQSIFPWLSTQTVGWEKYKFHSLRATYYTRTGTSTPGSVILAPDYDPADSAPSTEAQATSFHGAADDAPWKTITINFDMKRSRELFLRSGPLAANLDVKTYDFANLYVCTSDGTAVNWGKIFLEYDVELINPQIVQTIYAGGSISGGGVMSGSAPLGSIPVINPGSCVLGVTSTGTASRVSFTNLVIGQRYIFQACALGTGITAITTVNLTGATNNGQFLNDVGSATQMLDAYVLTPTATTATIDFSATATTVTSSWITMAPINNTIV